MDEQTRKNLMHCREVLAMLDRLPPRYRSGATTPEDDPDFRRYYELGRVHLDRDAVDRIARDSIQKARKAHRNPTKESR